ALVARLVEPTAVGSVTGIVGAVGGLGGFVPPLLLGWFWTTDSNYRMGLLLLFVLSLVTAALTWLWFLRTPSSGSADAERTPARPAPPSLRPAPSPAATPPGSTVPPPTRSCAPAGSSAAARPRRTCARSPMPAAVNRTCSTATA